MAVVDANTEDCANPSIGEGPDAARYDAKRKLAFSSNGGGTLTIIDASKRRTRAAEPGHAKRSAHHDPHWVTAAFTWLGAFGERPARRRLIHAAAAIYPDSFTFWWSARSESGRHCLASSS